MTKRANPSPSNTNGSSVGNVEQTSRDQWQFANANQSPTEMTNLLKMDILLFAQLTSIKKELNRVMLNLRVAKMSQRKNQLLNNINFSSVGNVEQTQKDQWRFANVNQSPIEMMPMLKMGTLHYARPISIKKELKIAMLN